MTSQFHFSQWYYTLNFSTLYSTQKRKPALENLTLLMMLEWEPHMLDLVEMHFYIWLAFYVMLSTSHKVILFSIIIHNIKFNSRFLDVYQMNYLIKSQDQHMSVNWILTSSITFCGFGWKKNCRSVSQYIQTKLKMEY